MLAKTNPIPDGFSLILFGKSHKFEKCFLFKRSFMELAKILLLIDWFNFSRGGKVKV